MSDILLIAYVSVVCPILLCSIARCIVTFVNKVKPTSITNPVILYVENSEHTDPASEPNTP
jgi:hypothetical protein